MKFLFENIIRKIIRVTSWILIIFLFLVLPGCGGGDTPEEDAGSDKKETTKKAPPKRRAPRRRAPSSRAKSTASRSKKPSGKTQAVEMKTSLIKRDVSSEKIDIPNKEYFQDRMAGKLYYPGKYNWNVFRDYRIRIAEQVDTDKDGIPDVYDDDIDGDGFSNKEEQASGTNPYDPNDYPKGLNEDILKGESSLLGEVDPMGAREKLFDTPITTNTEEKKSSSNSKGSKKSAETEDQDVKSEAKPEQKNRIAYKGLFGIRSNKMAIVKLVLNEKENILLLKEGDKILDNPPLMVKEIPIDKDYIVIEHAESKKEYQLTLRSDDSKDSEMKQVDSEEEEPKGKKKTTSKKSSAKSRQRKGR